MRTLRLNKFSALAAAAALLSLYACSKAEIETAMEMQEITVKIGIDTKTTLNAVRNKLEWSEKDVIGILNRVSVKDNQKIKYTKEGEITISIPATAGRIYGYYPYANGTVTGTYDNSINDGELQNAAGSLNGINTPMFAYSKVTEGKASLLFRPVSAILALNIYSASGVSTYGKIRSVTVKTGSIACAGASTADLNTTESPVFAGTKTSSRTAMLTPCDVLGSVPADEASRETFPNQIYVNVAKKSYSEGMTFEIRTDAETNNLYTISTSKVYDLSATDLQFININLDKATPSTEAADAFAPESCDESDLLATYLAGGQVSVAGETFSKATNPVYTVKKVSDLTMDDLTTDCGVIFLDNSETPGEVEFKSTGAVKGLTFSPAKIIVGRYSNDHGLPLIKWTLPANTGGDNTWRISGKNLFKNVHIIMTTGTLNASKAGFCSATTGDPAELIMDNCRFEASNDYNGTSLFAGFVLLTTEEARKVTGNGHLDEGVGFKTIRVHNSILAYDFALVGSYPDAYVFHHPELLEEITFRNCVFSHSNSVNRKVLKASRLLSLGTAGNPADFLTPNLNLTINNCSFFDLPTNNPSAMISIRCAKSYELCNNVLLPMTGWSTDIDPNNKNSNRAAYITLVCAKVEDNSFNSSEFYTINGGTYKDENNTGNYPINFSMSSNNTNVIKGRFTNYTLKDLKKKEPAELFGSNCVVNDVAKPNADYYYPSLISNCGADYSKMTWRDWE